MHKIVSAATTGSVGDLGRIARKLADAGFNIGAVGGGEAPMTGGGEFGIVSFAFHDDDNDNGQIRDIISGTDLGNGRTPSSVEEHPALVVELKDAVGQLAEAAEVLGNGDHNIMGVLLIDNVHGIAHVGLGFEDVGHRDQAALELFQAGFTIIADHDDH